LKWGKVKWIVRERGLMDVIMRQTRGTKSASPRMGTWQNDNEDGKSLHTNNTRTGQKL
jgi:hypothetical protein